MAVNPDFEDLFRALNEEKAKYLVVGAYAVTFHAEPRYTNDLDIWIEPTVENAKKVWTALAKFGAPLEDITASDFTDESLVYQVGIEPNRIDVMMAIEGLKFAAAWKNRVESKYGKVAIFILGLEDLIRAKKASARPQDLVDIEILEKVLKKN